MIRRYRVLTGLGVLYAMKDASLLEAKKSATTYPRETSNGQVSESLGIRGTADWEEDASDSCCPDQSIGWKSFRHAGQLHEPVIKPKDHETPPSSSSPSSEGSHPSNHLSNPQRDSHSFLLHCVMKCVRRHFSHYHHDEGNLGGTAVAPTPLDLAESSHPQHPSSGTSPSTGTSSSSPVTTSPPSTLSSTEAGRGPLPAEIWRAAHLEARDPLTGATHSLIFEGEAHVNQGETNETSSLSTIASDNLRGGLSKSDVEYIGGVVEQMTEGKGGGIGTGGTGGTGKEGGEGEKQQGGKGGGVLQTLRPPGRGGLASFDVQSGLMCWIEAFSQGPVDSLVVKCTRRRSHDNMSTKENSEKPKT